MRRSDLNSNPVVILQDAMAEAIASIGLRGEDARKAATRARREMREKRWRGIVAESNRFARVPRLTDEERERSVTH